MLKEIDYKNDVNAKPPYSYAALICLAMKDTKKKMTLSQIYKWIRDSFAYYRKADKSWQVRWRTIPHSAYTLKTLQTKGGYFSESAIRFSNLQISKKNIPKNYPELEI